MDTLTDAQWKAERLAAERHWEYLMSKPVSPVPAPKNKIQVALEAAMQEPKRLPWEK